MAEEFRRELDDHIYPRLTNHEDRIVTVEEWKERAIGVGIGLGLAAGLPTLALAILALTGKLGGE